MHLMSPGSLQINMDAVNKCRVISTLFGGVSAGILGFGAGEGSLWFLITILFTSLILYIKIKLLGSEDNGDSKYFHDAISTSMSGMFGNVMTYLLFWIMFYNIVYVI